jgi:signal transduction histidine kinase
MKMSSGVDCSEERVLVLAPVGRDAELTTKILSEAGIASLQCRDARSVGRELALGAGVVLLAEEALTPEALAEFLPALADQPAWSDVPLVVIAKEDPSAVAVRSSLELVERLGHVTLLDRPVRLISLLSALRVALRARKKQYEARDLLARLREGVEQRDKFLAMLGHELRNPLAAIVYAVARLPRDAANSARSILERQSSHLARLVDDLLDVARVTSGKITLQRVSVDLRGLVERCVEAARTSAPALAVVSELGDGEVRVEVDPVRMEQVVTNLLVNAVKYTPPGGAIRVKLRRAAGSALLTVADDGVGVSAEMLPRIFDLFTQVDGTLDRARGGLGIGLTVVRGIVELHGGSVRAFSAGRDCGTRFEVRLALAVAWKAEPKPAAPVATPARGRHVLLVEDDDDIRDSLQALLEQDGHVVDAAPDGTAAIARADATKPEIALVDIGLPGMSGYDVARALRGTFGTRIYLAAMTGYGLPEDRARAREAGFDVHLTKPVDFDRVEQLLRNAPVR